MIRFLAAPATATEAMSSSVSDVCRDMLFGAATHDILADFLVNLNRKNKEHLRNVLGHSGSFKERKLVEYIFLVCQELRLDLFTGYQALEILERYMTKLLAGLLSMPAHGREESLGSILRKLRERFTLTVFTSIQLASKLALHCRFIDNNTAVRFLHQLGYNYTKEALLESEIHILKTLDFCINFQNPLTYVEVLMEVLGYNDSTVPVPRLYTICQQVLQFVYLQRNLIYDHLLVSVTESLNPTQEQRAKFVTVKEDCVLLAAGVIATGAFILSFTSWSQIVDELSSITAISGQSIVDFAYVILKQIRGNETPTESLFTEKEVL
ncbi:cyclin N-terminal domain-containing protein 1 [Lepisosteus oculatus]|uniref:cyclin N-terminal domain-containing protein 1 n=1 Tax=Lepisosteus oculatus TaxID=7918 RepID=UPI00371652DF